jgi:DNA polymerase-3 subunit gamma/tau
MATLYRKYRPQTFADAVGQNHIKLTVQSELATGRVAHAYLFCGPRAVGKTTFARLLAKSINCLNRKEGEFEPCGECSSCLDISDGRALDVIEIDAASNTGVDNVRDNIIASARVSPSKSKFKVFIIDEVHMLSISAFNALLKVLEEPPKRVVFILCTTETHKVPATIISRCERFDFKRIGRVDIVKKLSRIAREEKIKISDDILEAVARQSEGHMRDAESLLGQLVAIGGQEISASEADLVIPRSAIGEIVKLIECLAKKDGSSAIALVNKLLDDGVDLEKFAQDLIELLRKVLIYKINPALGEKLGLDIGESYELKINELKKDLPVERIVLFLEKMMAARASMKSAFITQLPLEMAIAELCLEPSQVCRPLPPAGNIAQQVPRAYTAPANATQSMQSNPVIQHQAVPGSVSGAPAAPQGAVPVSDVKMSLEDFGSRWGEFLAKIKKNNHSLSFILKTCQPRGVDGGKACLAFKYKFHKDRVNEAKMREAIHQTLREVYGANLVFEAIIDEAMEIEGGNSAEFASSSSQQEAPLPEEAPSIDTTTTTPEQNGGNDVMSNLLKTFGGKIVG